MNLNTIYFKPGGGQPKGFFNTPHGWLVVGANHPGSDQDETIMLSAECRTIGELKAQGERLKGLIDEAIQDAEAYLPN